MFKKMLSPFIEDYSPMIWVMLMLIVIVAVFAPLLVIQSLNILFNLSIPYNLQTWCSVVVFHAFITTAVK
jgi:hypothetical protein